MVVLMIAQAAAVLMRGELTYDNAYQLPVFAPFAILIGVLALVLLAVLAGQAIRSERRKTTPTRPFCPCRSSAS